MSRQLSLLVVSLLFLCGFAKHSKKSSSTSVKCSYELNGYEYDLSKLSNTVIKHDNFYGNADWQYEYSPCRNDITIRTFKGMAKQTNMVNGYAYILGQFESDVPLSASPIYSNMHNDDAGDSYNYDDDMYFEGTEVEGFMLTWQNGDSCGSSGAPRTFNVHFMCSNDKYYGQNDVTMVESPSCTYTLTVPTRYACKKYATKVVSSSSGGSRGSRVSARGEDSYDSFDYVPTQRWSPLTTFLFVCLFGFVLYMAVRFVINVKNDPQNDWTNVNNIPHLELWLSIKRGVMTAWKNVCDVFCDRGEEYAPLVQQNGAPSEREPSEESALSLGVGSTQQQGVDRVIGVQEL